MLVLWGSIFLVLAHESMSYAQFIPVAESYVNGVPFETLETKIISDPQRCSARHTCTHSATDILQDGLIVVRWSRCPIHHLLSPSNGLRIIVFHVYQAKTWTEYGRYTTSPGGVRHRSASLPCSRAEQRQSVYCCRHKYQDAPRSKIREKLSGRGPTSRL